MEKATVTSQPLERAMPSTTPHLVSAPREIDEGRLAHLRRKLTTREGWVGSYDYGALCMPRLLPWAKQYRRDAPLELASEKSKEPPFYGLNQELPILLAILCGLQHTLASIAGLVVPPIILGSTFNLDTSTQAYLISASLIVSGICSALQISAIKLPFLGGGYQWGSGLVSIVGVSFATLGVTSSVASTLYADGTCPMVPGPNGTMVKGACPDGLGLILGTSAVCALFEILLSFIPPRSLKRLFPRYITGVVVLLIGLSLLSKSGFVGWAGGSSCQTAGTLCTVGSKRLPFGSPELLGLGLYSFLTLVLIEMFGSPALRSASIIIALIFCTLTAGIPGGYTSRATIDQSPAITFLWVKTFKLGIYGPAVLPLLLVYLVLCVEALGDTSASAEVSRVATRGEEFDRRLQGAVFADGVAGIISSLCTVTPLSVYAQNVSVLSITGVANRQAGYWACVWLVLFGILSKISGVILAIPGSIWSGVSSFLFASVSVAGISLLSKCTLTRRTRFIIASELVFGAGNLLVPSWSKNLLPSSSNSGVQGLLSSVAICIQTPYLISAIVGLILNTVLPYDLADTVVFEKERREEREEAEAREMEQGDATGNSATPSADERSVKESPAADQGRAV